LVDYSHYFLGVQPNLSMKRLLLAVVFSLIIVCVKIAMKNRRIHG